MKADPEMTQMLEQRYQQTKTLKQLLYAQESKRNIKHVK